MKNKKTLLLCSYGLEPAQITLETIQELKTCGAVFSSALESGRADMVRPYCRELHFLKTRRREHAAGKIFQAFRRFDKIAFLTYGNPFFLNQQAGRLKEKAARLGIEFRVLAGVSSFDAIINLLGLLGLENFSPEGLRLINLGDGHPQKRGLDIKLDTLFLSMWALGTKNKAFLAGLRAAYGPSHPALIIDHPSCVKTTVNALEKELSPARLKTTLYLPSAGHRSVFTGRLTFTR